MVGLPEEVERQANEWLAGLEGAEQVWVKHWGANPVSLLLLVRLKVADTKTAGLEVRRQPAEEDDEIAKLFPF